MGPLKGNHYPVEADGILLPWLVEHVPGMNRTEAKNALRLGRIVLNGMVVERHDTALSEADTITVLPHGFRHPKDLPFEVIYEDEHLIVVDKPSGLLTVGTDTDRQRTLHRLLGERERANGNAIGRVFVVHRLDRETSGVVLFAKTEKVKDALQSAWEDVEKVYFAVVQGTPNPREGTLTHWLKEDRGGLFVHVVPRSEFAQRAITHYRVEKSYGDRSLLQLVLETGRKHQIRVQLAEIGHAILGDSRYSHDAPAADRLMLHAMELRFTHPVTRERFVVEAPLPAPMRRI
jgi:23S rRNA pseudouridine1911/1915/1917 synthase